LPGAGRAGAGRGGQTAGGGGGGTTRDHPPAKPANL